MATVALAALAVAGCAGEAVRFNNSLAEYNKRLNAAGKKFGETLTPALQGGNANAGQVRSAYNNMLSTVEAVKRDFNALTPPPSATGKRLADTYRKFLQGQEGMIKNQLGEITRMVEQGKANGGQIMMLLQQIEGQERRDLSELQEVQRQFAKENGITLKYQ